MRIFTKTVAVQRAIGLISFTLIIPLCHADPLMTMIREKNYPVEKHTVHTADGYILSVHRIPRLDVKPENRKVILLLHGFADSAAAFLNRNKQKSFAFELFEAGFDVFMLNARGNIFSQRHTKLNTSDSNYWNFSWHEIGLYDLPATIDYILDHTNQTKLAFVGVSQGCTAVLVMLSELPAYNDKISIAHLMAPAVIFKYLKAPIPRSMELMNLLGNLLQYSGVNDVTPHTITNSLKMISPLCSIPFGREICKRMFSSLFGPSLQYFDGMLDSIADHYPAGSSSNQLIHYLQIIATGKFHKFHFNETMNMKLYGSAEPPEYDLSKVRTKIHILYGIHDTLAPAENIPELAKKLGTNFIELSKFSGYNHIDFLYGRNLKPLHKKMLNILEEYN